METIFNLSLKNLSSVDNVDNVEKQPVDNCKNM